MECVWFRSEGRAALLRRSRAVFCRDPGKKYCRRCDDPFYEPTDRRRGVALSFAGYRDEPFGVNIINFGPGRLFSGIRQFNVGCIAAAHRPESGDAKTELGASLALVHA